MTRRNGRGLQLGLLGLVAIAGAADCKKSGQGSGTESVSSGSTTCPSGTERVESRGEWFCQKLDKDNNQVKHGPYGVFAAGARVKRGEYREGKRHGLWDDFDNGRRVKGRYAAGVRVGPWQAWHKNNVRRYVGSFDQGAPHGKWIWWYDNGKKRLEGAFHHGRPIGLWRRWTQTSKPVSETTLVDGDVASHRQLIRAPLSKLALTQLARPSVRKLLAAFRAAVKRDFQADHYDDKKNLLPKAFTPGKTGWLPAKPCCQKCPAAAAGLPGPPWQALKLRPPPARYQWRYAASGTNTKSRYAFDVRLALPCGGKGSYFRVDGSVDHEYGVAAAVHLEAPSR